MKNDFLRDLKASLYEKGDFFEYHFVDMTKEQFDSSGADFIKERETVFPSDIISKLDIDRIVRFNGLWLLIRFTDKKKEQLLFEKESDTKAK